MNSQLSALTIHVPNVWQTCEWYRIVFGFLSIISADATAARLDVTGQRLVFAAHGAQEQVSNHCSTTLRSPAKSGEASCTGWSKA